MINLAHCLVRYVLAVLKNNDWPRGRFGIPSGHIAHSISFETVLKKLTDGPYQGKYASGPDYLADSLNDCTKRAAKTVILSPLKVARKLLES